MIFIYLIIVLFSFSITLFLLNRIKNSVWNFNSIKYGFIHPQLKRKYIKTALVNLRVLYVLLLGSMAILLYGIYLIINL